MKLLDVKDIIVGGLLIEVNAPNHDLINNGLLGHYLSANLEIGIRNDLPLQLQGNVLIHEVTHAIANVYCEGLDLNEAQVAGIAQGFYQVLTDNEDLVQFITQLTQSDESERPLDMVMNGHVQNSEQLKLGHEYDQMGIDTGGH
jgi:hypothetical protein